MHVACLDLEGVLVPEIWINVAISTGIEALQRTTRDEPDYDKLMRGRIEILDRHGLKLADIQQVIGTMEPLEGASAFLDGLRERCSVIVLSDTFDAVLPAADAQARLANAVLQHARDRPCGSNYRLPFAPEGRQAESGRGTAQPRVSGDRRGRLVQRYEACSPRQIREYSSDRPTTSYETSRSFP